MARQLSRAFPSPAQAYHGLYELLLNAVEHGNLGLGLEEKAYLLRVGKWESELRQRLDHPHYKVRRAQLWLRQDAQAVQVIIQDEGEGFDWHHYLTFAQERLHYPNGRGIAMANLFAFDRLEYEGNGNRVICSQRRTE